MKNNNFVIIFNNNKMTCVTILDKEYDINLKRLFISRSQLSSLPTIIGNLINLEELVLSHNKLSSLPAVIGNLINLKILDLSNNKLNSLHVAIGNLINLHTLMGLEQHLLTSVMLYA